MDTTLKKAQEKNIEQQMHFNISSFEGINVEITKFKHQIEGEYDKKNIEININMDLNSIDDSKHEVEIFTHVRYIYNIESVPEDNSNENAEESISLLHIDTLITFKLSNYDVCVKNDNNELYLNVKDLALFFGIAFASTRGYVSAKSEGTLYNDLPLPSVNPTSFIKENKKEYLKEDKYYLNELSV